MWNKHFTSRLVYVHKSMINTGPAKSLSSLFQRLLGFIHCCGSHFFELWLLISTTNNRGISFPYHDSLQARLSRHSFHCLDILGFWSSVIFIDYKPEVGYLLHSTVSFFFTKPESLFGCSLQHQARTIYSHNYNVTQISCSTCNVLQYGIHYLPKFGWGSLDFERQSIISEQAFVCVYDTSLYISLYISGTGIYKYASNKS